eukprot:jgi/Phyca11/536918/estExt2_fgenesh1_pg.C_PHYCAscaffold_670003
MDMKVGLDKLTPRRLVKVTNYALVQVLKSTVTRLRKVEMELGDLELALEDEQEEVESYSDDIDDCHDRIEDIDEFVRELQAGNVNTVSNVAAALAEMTEERQEEQKLLKVLSDARASHEKQFDQLQSQSTALKTERLVLTKTRYEICCLFRRNGVFELVRRRLAAIDPKLFHIFGLKSDVHSNVAFVDDQTVAYPAGHHVIVCSLDDKRQKFIAATEASEGVTATALAPSRRFLAVAERSERALVSIFDLKTLKKRKVLSSADAQARSYVSMAFSADNQLLLTQGGAPDWMLTCWNWSKGKPVASVKAPLHVMAPHASPSSAIMAHLSSSPSDANLIASGTTNSGVAAAAAAPPQVSACSFSDVDAGLVCVTAFRPLPSPRMESHAFLAHAWLKQRDDYLVAGSAAGDLMLFHGVGGDHLLKEIEIPSSQVTKEFISSLPLVKTVQYVYSSGSAYHHEGFGGHGGLASFSEEILVTKSDLEEKNTLMLELKNKVDELMLHNEYQLRLKDMTYNENLKDLTEKFTHEIELEKNKYELLREDKNDIEMEYEEKIKQLEEHHLQQMQETEAAFQQKIMKEVERYQEVLTQREAQCLHWKSEQQRLVTTHDKYVADRQRINSLQKAIAGHRQVLSDQQTSMRRFRCDLHECVRHLQSPKELALQVAQLYNKYVTADDGGSTGGATGDVETEIQLEYARQKQYLEKSVHVLKRKYAADAQEHQRENLRATSDNMILIREINDLRGAVVAAKNNLQMERATLATAGLGTSTMNQAKTRGNKSLAAALEAAGGDLDVLIDRQRTEIEELRRAVKALEDKLAGNGLGGTKSGDVFPPIGRAVDG